MYASALGFGHLVGLLANDDSQFRLPVERGRGVLRNDDVVVRPGEGLLELREQRRVLGQLAAHLLDVRGVVEADADDLAGVWDDGSVVRGREVDGSARSVLRDRFPVWSRPAAPTHRRSRR